MMCLQEGVKMERKNLALSTLYLALYTKFTKNGSSNGAKSVLQDLE